MASGSGSAAGPFGVVMPGSLLAVRAPMSHATGAIRSW
jgi:hypothetical protein